LGLSTANDKPQLSIVIPVFNEEANIGELCHRIQLVMDAQGIEYEVILVDDLSADQTFEKIAVVHEQNQRFKAIQFSRRFGYQTSIFVGLGYARGEMVITMDSDLQHPPEIIPQMLAKHGEGYDVVNMVRSNLDQKSLLSRVGSKLFYGLINRLSPTPIAFQSADFRLYSRRVIEALGDFPERSLFLRGLVGWVGFRQVDMPFEEEGRRFGNTKFGQLSTLVRFAVSALVSFSTSPLYSAIYLGLFSVMAGVVYGAYYLFQSLLNVSYPPGWVSIICLILLIGGTHMILLGIIGVYIAEIFTEVKGRPRYLVGRMLGVDSDLSELARMNSNKMGKI